MCKVYICMHMFDFLLGFAIGFESITKPQRSKCSTGVRNFDCDYVIIIVSEIREKFISVQTFGVGLGNRARLKPQRECDSLKKRA